jgi:hypothetical protein
LRKHILEVLFLCNRLPSARLIQWLGYLVVAEERSVCTLPSVQTPSYLSSILRAGSFLPLIIDCILLSIYFVTVQEIDGIGIDGVFALLIVCSFVRNSFMTGSFFFLSYVTDYNTHTLFIMGSVFCVDATELYSGS